VEPRDPLLMIGKLGAPARSLYIPFPDSLRGKYQSPTEADLSRLRGAAARTNFTSGELRGPRRSRGGGGGAGDGTCDDRDQVHSSFDPA